MKPIVLTQHAQLRMGARAIPFETVERAIRSPLWTAPDPQGAGVERRYHTHDPAGHVVRVVCVETPRSIRVISAMHDRNARPPP